MPKIASRTYDPRSARGARRSGITIGMGMTEKQGGTDVRANTTRADARWRGLPHHRTQMVHVGADVRRVSGAGAGARRAHLFPDAALSRPTAAVNGCASSGSRTSSATAPMRRRRSSSRSAFAWRVGEEGRGVRTIIEMVQLTRLDCAIASAGMMRMALGAGGASRAPPHRVPEDARRSAADAHGARRSCARMSKARSPLMMRLCRSFDLCGERCEGSGACAPADAGGQILDLQDRAGSDLRSDGMPRRQWLRRGRHLGAALSRGAGQRDLGRLGQRRLPRCAACAVARRRSGARRARRACR